jgi:hypothetical protein
VSQFLLRPSCLASCFATRNGEERRETEACIVRGERRAKRVRPSALFGDAVSGRGLQENSFERLGELEREEPRGGIPVVLAALVDDPEMLPPSRSGITR